MANTFPRYAIWNNKGGVGKTFVTFVVAAEYARIHPDRRIIILDLCPQANISEILLGGNKKGSDALEKLLSVKSGARKTIGGYFDQRVSQPHSKTGTEVSFLTQVNPHLPKNMLMVAGDPSLELQSQTINQIAIQPLPAQAWANVHRWVKDLADAIVAQHPEAVFFIDCNPSFSAYTELALLAATRLIVPCTADGSSARAIDNVGRLLYGVNVPQIYKGADFFNKATNEGLALPSIHLVPLNRSTQYGEKASAAFSAMYQEIQRRIKNLQTKAPTYFSLPKGHNPFFDIPDAHAVALQCSHEGLPLHRLTAGLSHIHGVKNQINSTQLKKYRDAVTKLVALL